jgi:hypothetical protein
MVHIASLWSATQPKRPVPMAKWISFADPLKPEFLKVSPEY